VPSTWTTRPPYAVGSKPPAALGLVVPEEGMDVWNPRSLGVPRGESPAMAHAWSRHDVHPSSKHRPRLPCRRDVGPRHRFRTSDPYAPCGFRPVRDSSSVGMGIHRRKDCRRGVSRISWPPRIAEKSWQTGRTGPQPYRQLARVLPGRCVQHAESQSSHLLPGVPPAVRRSGRRARADALPVPRGALRGGRYALVSRAGRVCSKRHAASRWD
jgi:hypothetical protein